MGSLAVPVLANHSQPVTQRLIPMNIFIFQEDWTWLNALSFLIYRLKKRTVQISYLLNMYIMQQNMKHVTL